MTEALVVAENLSMDYAAPDGERVPVLRGVDCAVASRARIALIGPSGSGKSTLLHIMGGVVAPTAGTIRWPALGPRGGLMPERVQFVYQMPSLFAPLSVVENVALPILLAGRVVDPEAQAMEVLAHFGLEELATKLPEELSGGQAQRIAMARALAGRPDLVLADEPTGQLDTATARQFLDRVEAWLDGAPTALVVATHDPGVAERMTQRWTLDHGRLQAGRKEPETLA